MKKFLVCVIGLWISCTTLVQGQPMIAVTAVEVVPLPHLSGGPGLTENKKGAKALATVVLNNCIRISEIEVYPITPQMRVNGVYPFSGTEDIVLRYPRWIDKNGREYPQIELLTRQAREEVRRAIQTRRKSSFQPQTQEFEIVRIKRAQPRGSTKAFCVVNFNKAVNLHCKVLKGKWGLWVGWPCTRSSVQGWPARPPEQKNQPWIKLIEIIDLHLKRSIKNAVLKKYRKISVRPRQGGPGQGEE